MESADAVLDELRLLVPIDEGGGDFALKITADSVHHINKTANTRKITCEKDQMMCHKIGFESTTTRHSSWVRFSDEGTHTQETRGSFYGV